MPASKAVRDQGVRGVNGMEPAFPPNTGVGWYTMMTGTWPSEHGSTNNTFHRTGEGNFNNRTGLGASILQADTLAQAAERAGKKVAAVEWVGARTHNLAGPVIDFRNFFSNRGIVAQLRPARPTRRGEQVRCELPACRAPAGSRVDERPDVVLPGTTAAAHQHQHRLPGGRQRHACVRPLHLRLDRRRDDQLRPRPRRSGDRRQGRQCLRCRSRCGRVGRRQGDPDRWTCRADGRLLPQGHRHRPRPLPVPRVLHLRHARDRLVRLRPELREHARQPVPDQHRGGLRAARGRDRRRGHLRRAGPQVDRLPLARTDLHHDRTPSRTRTCCSSAAPSRTSSSTSSWPSPCRPTWTATRTRTSTT